MKRTIFLLCLLCVFCLQVLAASEHSYKQQPQKQTIKVGTATREMLVYVPADLPEKAPMVISLHGFSQNPDYQMGQTHWNEVADTAKILVVYPQGNGNAWDISGSGDVKFIETIMKTMQKKYKVDKNRIYISGFSMGGMMTYHCMTKLGTVVAAFGPVSGIPVDYREPVAPRHVPIMHIHGTGDDVVKWGGDPNHAAGGYGRIDDYVKKLIQTYKELLDLWLQEEKISNPQNLVFVSRNCTENREAVPVNGDSFYLWLKRMCKKHQMPRIAVHSLRAMAATYALISGMPLNMVQAMMGHTDISTTSIYLRDVQDERKSAVALLSNQFEALRTGKE